MGPLRLLDLIGLDTAQAVAESRKSGRGFYAYPIT
jgi:3-hydroxyacyl-CoA dehydrogenase